MLSILLHIYEYREKFYHVLGFAMVKALLGLGRVMGRVGCVETNWALVRSLCSELDEATESSNKV